MPQGQLKVQSNGRREFIDLSGRIRTIVSESGIRDGLLVLYNPHTTAGLTINEGADADVRGIFWTPLPGWFLMQPTIVILKVILRPM